MALMAAAFCCRIFGNQCDINYRGAIALEQRMFLRETVKAKKRASRAYRSNGT